MKLSMSMLAWYLRDQHPICQIQDDDLSIQGLRFVSDEVEALQPEYLYFGEGGHFFSAQQYAGAYLAANRHSILVFKDADFTGLLNALLSAFDFFDSWEERLIDAQERSAPLRELVDIAAPAFGNPLAVGSLDMRFIVGSDLEGHRADPLWRSINEGRETHSAMYEPYFDIEGKKVQDLTTRPRLVRNVYEGGDPVMMLYLPQEDEIAGYVAVLQEDESLTQMNLQLAPVFARYCLHAHELVSDSGAIQTGSAIFDNLLNGKEVGKLNLERLQDLLPPPPWRLLALRVSGRTDKLALNALLGDLRKQRGCHFPIEQEGTCFCMAEEAAIKSLRPLTGQTAIGASAPAFELSSLPVRRRQAEFAMEHSHDTPGLFLCEDYACDYLLGAFRELELTATLLHPALEALERYDAENQAELRHTLAAYLRHERNQLLAAKELHVHANTMRYRLQRIREVAGLTLEDEAELKYLRLSDWLEL
ncbi:MAG: helix-turn-helix domain-containing protein [Eggerthellaceae bacterium]|nr:helix-turn-helix domain-containing protein [Eggerthellaceae bacterium]